jgi:hypothetical protein
MLNKLRKKVPIAFTAFVALIAAFSYAHPALAATERAIDAGMLGNAIVTGTQAIIEMIVGLLGKLTLQLIHILIMVAGYNGYMDSPAITIGWIITRDIANLFFVAAILVVSIGTIVAPDKFGGVSQIFKILRFALLVNFSRTIAALFIDVSQLVMLTFVNGFAAAAGGNFVEALGITKLTDIQPGNSALTFPSAMGGLFLALLMFIVITVIIAVLVVALVVRMVMLWMLVVLSPIAFAIGAFPGGEGHAKKWWSKFSEQLTTGPIVAFFLWLSLVSFQGSSGSDLTGQKLQENAAAGKEAVSVSCGETMACSEENMIRFIVAAVMLLTGLSFASQFGGVAGDLASGALSKGKGYANQALRWSARKAALPVAVGALGGVPAGVAAGAGYLALAKTNYGKQATNRVRGLVGKTLGGGNAVGNVVGWVPGVGSLGRSMTVAAGKKREEQMKDIRAKTSGLNEEQRMMLFKSPVQPQILKDVIALDIVKDKKYSKAKPEAKDEAERKRRDDFILAFKTLDTAGKAGDKDSADKAKEIKDARPDVAAAASGKASDLTDAAKNAGLEDLKKIDFGLMSKTDRYSFFGAMDPEILASFYEKGSTSEKKALIREFYGRNALPGSEAVKKGVDLSAQPTKRFNPETKKEEPNIELAVAVNVEGNDQHVRQLQRNPDIGALRKGVTEDLGKKVDYAQNGVPGGFTEADTRLRDEILREAEAGRIIGGDVDAAYGIRDNGSFVDERAKRSFEQSLKTAPKRVHFVLNQNSRIINGNDGGNEVTRDILDNLEPGDLSSLADAARTDSELTVVQNILKAATELWSDQKNALDAAKRQKYGDIASEAYTNEKLGRLSDLA